MAVSIFSFLGCIQFVSRHCNLKVLWTHASKEAWLLTGRGYSAPSGHSLPNLNSDAYSNLPLLPVILSIADFGNTVTRSQFHLFDNICSSQE